MDKVKVLLTAEADDLVLEKLRTLCDIEEAGWKKELRVLSEDELIEKLQGKKILVTSYDKITRRVIENSKDLELIVGGRANPVNVDVDAAKERGIKVAYTPGRNSDVTAEFAVALLLNVARKITVANLAMMNHEIVTEENESSTNPKKDVTWGKVGNRHPYSEFQGPQIRNKNVGIVGYGSIGRRVANIMSGFGANILVYDPYFSPVDINSPGVRLVSFDELVKESDFISSHIKVTEKTEGLFNYKTFEKMKNTAFFINNSRGAVVVEEDLIRALRENVIAGAGLDVFEYEPLYKNHPFVSGELKNIVATPHISGSSEDAIANGTLMIVDEITRFLNGEMLLNVK